MRPWNKGSFLNSANRQGPKKPSKLMKTLNWVTWGKRWQMLGQGVVSLQELRNSVDNFWFWKRRVVEACWGWPRDEFSGKHDVLWLEQHHFDGFNFRGLSHRMKTGQSRMTKHTQMLPTSTNHGAEKRTWWSMSFLASFHVFRWILKRSRCGRWEFEENWKTMSSRPRFPHFSMWKFYGNCVETSTFAKFSVQIWGCLSALAKGDTGKSTSNLKRHSMASMAHCFCKMILGSWLFAFAFSYSGSNKTHIKIESKMNRASINKLCMYTYIYM